ncbi:MAG: nucleotidyltransferase domain-containing protein [Thermoproteota archaeon]
MEAYFDILMKRAEMVKNWKKYVGEVAKAVKSLLPDSRIYVFGSVVKGEYTGGSDVDILIVSKEAPRSSLERVKIRMMIEESANLPPYHPFEFHIVDEEEGKRYFSKIKEIVEFLEYSFHSLVLIIRMTAIANSMIEEIRKPITLSF